MIRDGHVKQKIPIKDLERKGSKTITIRPSLIPKEACMEITRDEDKKVGRHNFLNFHYSWFNTIV